MGHSDILKTLNYKFDIFKNNGATEDETVCNSEISALTEAYGFGSGCLATSHPHQAACAGFIESELSDSLEEWELTTRNYIPHPRPSADPNEQRHSIFILFQLIHINIWHLKPQMNTEAPWCWCGLPCKICRIHAVVEHVDSRDLTQDEITQRHSEAVPIE